MAEDVQQISTPPEGKDPTEIKIDDAGFEAVPSDSSSSTTTSTTEGKKSKEKDKKSKIEEPHVEEELLPEQEIEEEELEDLFNKNTSSFRCLAQVLISRSSLMRSALYFFPELEDPGLDAALNYEEPDPAFVDGLGIEKYLFLCKENNIVPITRVKKGLEMEILNLRYYGLSKLQMKAICAALMLNTRVKMLDLQDNWMTPEMVSYLTDVLRENNTITCLNMRECRIGPQGAKSLNDGINTTQSLKELDLSYNDLGNVGLRAIAPGLRENVSIKKLNLSHNHLSEDCAKSLGRIIKENIGLDSLDLSWNELYSEQAMELVCEGLHENTDIRVLSLAWNGITTKEAWIHVMRYIKESQTLEELDISNNCCTDIPLRMIKAGVMACPTLQKLHMRNCKLTPDEVQTMAEIFTTNPTSELHFIDMENAFVKKPFIKLHKQIKKLGKDVNIEGVLGNYRIKGPDQKLLLFNRCKMLAMKAKKKKLQKDFGLFLYELGDELISKPDFEKTFKKAKMKKIDKDLIDALMKKFPGKDQKVDVVQMRNDFLERFPETQPPPPKKKKKKRGKKKKKGKKSATSSEFEEEELGEEEEEEDVYGQGPEPFDGEEEGEEEEELEEEEIDSEEVEEEQILGEGGIPEDDEEMKMMITKYGEGGTSREDVDKRRTSKAHKGGDQGHKKGAKEAKDVKGAAKKGKGKKVNIAEDKKKK